MVQGFYVFAGDVLSAGADTHSHMNSTVFGEFDFSAKLAELVSGNLGTVVAKVGYMSDHSDGKAGGGFTPIDNFVATVVYNKTTFVTRKTSSPCTTAAAAIANKNTTNKNTSKNKSKSNATATATTTNTAATRRPAADVATAAWIGGSNCFSFGGWAGLESSSTIVYHTIELDSPGFQTKLVQVHVASGTTTAIEITMEKE